jgi:two-component system, chemotaxis family, CheB/CheR fusion protein
MKKHRQTPKNTKRLSDTPPLFPVIGIGCSTGAVDPLCDFVAEIPVNSGIAYLIMMRVHPDPPDFVLNLLKKVTDMKVDYAIDGAPIQTDRIIVVPPAKEVNIFKGTVQLMDMPDHDVMLPIDYFFRSLARNCGEYAGGVVMSGAGKDGALGLRDIKTHEGLTVVQSIESAVYTDMPIHAGNTGFIDAVLPPKKMPKLIVDFFERRRGDGPVGEGKDNAEDKWLRKLFAILMSKVGHDFSQYKATTILRRIDRRMGVNCIHSLENYVQFLRETPSEPEKLFREFLIGVTQFFREEETFDFFRSQVLPSLMTRIHQGEDLRIWVPGCSSGEDAYSLAIIVREYLDKHPCRVRVKIFSTDIDGRGIDKARQGFYPVGIATEISQDRLNKYFTREGDTYRVCKSLRDMVVFSVQDIIKDPPFSRITVLCCRNFLIYLNAELQRKVLSLFHYTLVPDGFLILGSSETVGQFTNLFKPVNSKIKMYKRQEVPSSIRGPIEFPASMLTAEPSFDGTGKQPLPKKADLGEITKRVIADLCVPTAVLVDYKGTILYVHGRTGKYLETVSGPPTHNVIDMAREGLHIILSSALRKAYTSKKKVTQKNVQINTDTGSLLINLHVFPLKRPEALSGRYVIIFEDSDGRNGTPRSQRSGAAVSVDTQVKELEGELQSTRESHQTTIEELESANEELKFTNEELQSFNEELESSKEELQSLNEEMQTVNSELQNKVQELSAAHDDMHNLLNSIEVASIFVDNKIRIKRFTKQASELVSLIPSDIGRPLQDMVTKLQYSRLIGDVEDVLDKLIPQEREVYSEGGVWYHMKIIPYRTIDNRIDGAVLTFLSINEQKKAQRRLEKTICEKEQAWLLIYKIYNMLDKPLAVLDEQGKLVVANKAFTAVSRMENTPLERTNILEFTGGPFSQTELRRRLRDALTRRQAMSPETVVVTPDGDHDGYQERYNISGQVLSARVDEPFRYLLLMDGTTQERE